MTRCLRILVLSVVALAVLGQSALASTDLVQKRSFVAFSDDGTEFIILLDDANRGKVLEYWKLKGDKPHKTKAYDEDKLKRVLKFLKKKKFPDKGARGATKDGKFSVIHGVLGKSKYNIMISKDSGELARFKQLKVIQDKNSGNYAAATLKEIVWDKSGKKLVIVFNQRLETTSWTQDVDSIQSFRVNPIYLPFKKMPQ